MRRLYLDANPIICSVEGVPAFHLEDHLQRSGQAVQEIEVAQAEYLRRRTAQ